MIDGTRQSEGDVDCCLVDGGCQAVLKFVEKVLLKWRMGSGYQCKLMM